MACLQKFSDLNPDINLWRWSLPATPFNKLPQRVFENQTSTSTYSKWLPMHETPALESWFCNLFSKWLWKGHLGPLSLSTLAYKMGIATLMETWQDCYRDKWENVGERSCKILHFIQINFWFWKKDTSFNHTHSAAKKLKQRSQKYTVRVSLTLDMRDYLLAWNF
jgi:hypothetical protein